MAKASSSWQQLINQLSVWALPDFKTKATKQRTIRRFTGPGGVLGFLTIVVAMLLWNWKLLLSSSVGMFVMVLVYAMHKWDWQLRWSEIRSFFHSPNSRLAISVSSGGIACITTYTAAAIWVDSSSSWIAAGTIIQGLATLLTLILLVWQMICFYGSREDNQINQLLLNLTAEAPLKRLIAVRQLTKLASSKKLDSDMQQVAECLQLLLTREQEAVIRSAAFESLQALDRLQMLSSSTDAIKVPVKLKAKQHIYD